MEAHRCALVEMFLRPTPIRLIIHPFIDHRVTLVTSPSFSSSCGTGSKDVAVLEGVFYYYYYYYYYSYYYYHSYYYYYPSLPLPLLLFRRTITTGKAVCRTLRVGM